MLNQNGRAKGVSDAEPLPSNTDEYWQVGREHAENAVHTLRQVSCTSNEHYFAHTTAREVECIRCHVGYELATGWSVENGHIYNSGELVI